MTTKQPVQTIRYGRISAAIWKNVGDHNKVFYNFTLERLYADKNLSKATVVKSLALLTLPDTLQKQVN